MEVTIKTNNSGHMERLKRRFLEGDKDLHTDEALLELLLTYAIPFKDVQPLAKALLARFGSLQGVLSADINTLCQFDGIKTNSALLLKLTDWLILHNSSEKSPTKKDTQGETSSNLFETLTIPLDKSVKIDKEAPLINDKQLQKQRGTRFFVKSVLKDAILLLPKMTDVQTLDDVKAFLRDNLHYSAQQTRKKYSNYIARRLFPQGFVDKALLFFAVKYERSQALKDVCLYRFCKAEPLMYDVIKDHFLPFIGIGKLKRKSIREYLKQLSPSSNSIGDTAKEIVNTLTAAGVARADRTTVYFSFREIMLPSFAFILHSEFPEPGMYDISKIETNKSICSLFWNPNRILPSLYELRNKGLISKVSEIDNIRQFTTRWTLDELVTRLEDDKA